MKPVLVHLPPVNDPLRSTASLILSSARGIPMWTERGMLGMAEELLEGSDLPVERIATDVGFANAATLRQHFVRVRGVSPRHYRRTFAGNEAS